MSTFEINDGLGTILFHTLLPPPDEEEADEGEKKDGGGGKDVLCQAEKTFSISLTISCVITDVV